MSFLERLNAHYDDMLRLRVSLGYAVGKNPEQVREFIVFCGNGFPDSMGITKEMLDSWLESKTFNTNSTHNYAITKIRGFTRYLQSVGVPAFVPPTDYSVKVVRYNPYIFTDEELSRLFAAIDRFPPYHSSPNREYIVPVIFRMMYCCGMRPSEPPSLLLEDVNFKTGEIYIRQSKGFQDRRVLMSADLTDLCARYASRMMPQRYLFELKPGERVTSEWITHQFGYCWKNSGLPKRGSPRPYDFRHNFVTRTFMKWINEGKDVNALAPYLSSYLGHKELTATLYYLRLLPEHLLNSAGIDWSRFSRIYKGVLQ